MRLKKGISLTLLVLMLSLSMLSSALAGTIYVGNNIGFDADKISNDPAYAAAYQNYLSQHANDPIIINNGFGSTYNATDYSNAPKGTDPSTLPQKTAPTGASVWDGTGPSPSQVTITAINAQTVAVGSTTDVTVATTPSDATITATSDATAKATVAVNGNKITVTGVAVGTANINVSATKTGMVTGTATFAVTINAADNEAPVITTSASTVNVTADKQKVTFTVTDNNAVKTVTAKQGATDLTVTKEATDNTYSVLVNEVKGANVNLLIDATDNAGNAAVEKTITLVDKVNPTITNVQAVNNKTILVTFSEPVADTALATLHASYKYSLYNVTNGTTAGLSTDGDNADLTVTTAFASTDKTQIKFIITAIGLNCTGYPNGGLANSGYIFYASRNGATVDDRATTTNHMTIGTPKEFTGTLTPDSAAPTLISSSFNSTSGLVTLTFDKATTGAQPASNLVYFQVGSNKVMLQNGLDFNGIAGTTTVTFTVNTTATTGTLAQINALGSNPQIVLADGAFTDGTNATVAQTSTPTITTGPMLTSVTYDENTNTAVFKFSKTIDVSAITTFAGGKFNIGGVDIQDANLVFNNTADSSDLSFKLSDAKAQAVEAAVRGGNLTATVANGEVQDTDATPNANVAATSAVTLVIGTTYIKDTTPPVLNSATYNDDTKVLQLTFNEPVRNTIGDFTEASVQFYQDDNGVAGLQTTAVNGVPADNEIATLANTDLAGGAAIGQTGLRTDATGNAAATLNSEVKTIYIKDQDIAHKLDVSLDAAVAAGKDIYVNVLAGGLKDANTNATTAVQSVKVSNVTVSNSTAITGATSITFNVTLGQIAVNFSNGSAVAMDSSTATNPANYNLYLTANPLAKVSIDSITMNANNTVATILFSSPLTAATSYSLKTSGIKTASGAAGDIDGTAIPAISFVSLPAADHIALSATQALVLTDKDNSGTVSTGDTIAITFNEPVKLPTTLAISDLTVSNSHTLGNSTFALSADKKTFTITVGSSATIAVGDTITFPVTIKDYEGNALAVGATQTTNAMTVSGNTAPVIVSAVYTDTNANGVVDSGDTVVVTFDQNVALKTGKVAADLNDEFNFNAHNDRVSAVALSGKTATLTLNSNIVPADLTAANLKTSGGTGDLVNVWGTATNDAAGKAVTYTDTTSPTITGFAYKVGTRTLTVSFSEAVNATSAGAATLAKAIAAKLTATGGTLGTQANITGGTLAADGKSFNFVLDVDASIDQYTTLTIAAGVWNLNPGADFIRDASLNYAVRGQGTAYSITVTQ